MQKGKRLSILVAAVFLVALVVIVFGKIYIIRDDSGASLLWNSKEAYLFTGVRRTGVRIRYLEYPWAVIYELLNGVRSADDQRTSLTVVHMTASGVERHVIEASDEEPANTPDFYTPFEGNIYANYHGSLLRWTGDKFEAATAEEQRRLDGTNRLASGDIEKDPAGWSKRGFGPAGNDYEFAVDVGGNFTVNVTNRRIGESEASVLSVTRAVAGQSAESIWRVDEHLRTVSKTEYEKAFKRN